MYSSYKYTRVALRSIIDTAKRMCGPQTRYIADQNKAKLSLLEAIKLKLLSGL